MSSRAEQTLATRDERREKRNQGFRLLAVSILLSQFWFLTACGFTPLYGHAPAIDGTGASAGPFDQISISSIPDEDGQYLRNALIDRFYTQGRPSGSRYTLTVSKINERRTDLDITNRDSATRTQLHLTATMTLTDLQTGKTLLSRDLVAINSYNILQSEYTTRVSQNFVRQNALDDIARQIQAQLALYFKRKP